MSNIKGYKVFNPDWTCRGFQYEVGKTYEHDGNIEMCGAGFHFCRKISECFNYYAFDKNNKVAEVEALGLIETIDDKSVTNKIKIIRELSWQEVLEKANSGSQCTGRDNSGNRNSGDRNSGNWNSGNCNSGDWNSGDWNSGDCNSGNCNSGNCNSGNRNSGDWNSGNRNSGDRNSGDRNSGNRNSGNRNSGDWNSGNRNSGDCNSGNCNSGNCNSGNCNSGNRNSGDWNSGNCNSGFFNSITTPFYAFNQELEISRDKFLECKGVQILEWHFDNNWWIYSQNMSEEEKKNHPEHETTGGYLKVVDYKTACKIMWDNLTDKEKEEVKKIPNFDKDVFKKITGIEV